MLARAASDSGRTAFTQCPRSVIPGVRRPDRHPRTRRPEPPPTAGGRGSGGSDGRQAPASAGALDPDDGKALLFTAPDGGVLRYSNWLRRVWWPACVAAGVGRMVEDEASGQVRYEGLGFHDLRRAAATGLVAEGVDVKTAQGLLGHSDSRLTLDHYAQVVTERGEAAAKAMGRRFLRPAPRDERAIEGP